MNTQECSIGGSGGTASFAESVNDSGGLNLPLKVKLMKLFLNVPVIKS